MGDTGSSGGGGGGGRTTLPNRNLWQTPAIRDWHNRVRRERQQQQQRDQQRGTAGNDGGLGGGVRGARELTDRERQRATFADVGPTGRGYDVTTERQRQSITAERLDDLGLRAQQTTLGTTLSPREGFNINTATRAALGALGEEQAIGAETFLGASPEDQATVARGLTRGSLRAAAPTAAQPLERSPLGTLASLAGGVFGGTEAIRGLGTASRAIGAVGLTAQTAATLAAPAVGLYGLGSTLYTLGEEEGLRGTFVAPRTDVRTPTMPTGGTGDGAVPVATPEPPTVPPTQTTTNIPVVAPPRRRAMGSGFASTVRTGYFGRIAPRVRRLV